jgi:hypothetical protein
MAGSSNFDGLSPAESDEIEAKVNDPVARRSFFLALG